MRNLVYHIASTVDGFIAHPDHTVDGFVADGEHASEYLAALKQDYDVVIMGRRTYEFGVQFGVTNPYPWMKQYVVSRSMERSLDPHVELVTDNVGDLVRRLKREDGKAIYLCGGGELAATLFAEGLVEFPPVLGAIAAALPFQAIYFVPIALYVGAYGGSVTSAILTQLLWASAVLLLCRMVWSRVQRRIVVQGG